jgi:hypothetical protein
MERNIVFQHLRAGEKQGRIPLTYLINTWIVLVFASPIVAQHEKYLISQELQGNICLRIASICSSCLGIFRQVQCSVLQIIVTVRGKDFRALMFLLFQ